MVSLYGTFGALSSTSTPYLRFSRSTDDLDVQLADAGEDDLRVCGSRCISSVGSSSIMRAAPASPSPRRPCSWARRRRRSPAAAPEARVADRRLLVGERVAGRGVLQLRDRADLAGDERAPPGVCFLPSSAADGPMRSLASLLTLSTRRVAVQLAAEHVEDGQLAGERIDDGLEHERRRTAPSGSGWRSIGSPIFGSSPVERAALGRRRRGSRRGSRAAAACR